MLPISLEFLALELMKQLELSKFEPMEARYVELIELEEIRGHAVQMIEKDQTLVKIWFDKKVREKTFQEGDLVPKWDADWAKPGRHSKFDAIWSGPYMVTGCKSSNAFQLSTLDGEELSIPVNGIYLKHCY